MQRKIHLLAVIAILILAITVAQAYESQYDSHRQEDREEFLRRLFDALEHQENIDRRRYILQRCPIRC